MVDERVGEVEPHWGIEDVPAGEVAMWNIVACVRHLYTDFEVVACVRVDCWRGSTVVPRECCVEEARLTIIGGMIACSDINLDDRY